MGIQKEAHFTMLILYWSASAFEHMFFREVDMHLGGVFWLKCLHLSVCFTFCKRITKSIWNSVEIFMSPTWKFQMKFEYNKHPANVYPLHSTFLPWKEIFFFHMSKFFFSFFYLKIQVYCWLQRVGPKWILIWQNFLAVKEQL